MSDQHINVNIDQMKILGPVVAAQLTTAFYLNLVLRQLKGEAPTGVMDQESFDAATMVQVNEVWMAIWGQLDLVSKNTDK